MRIAIRGFIGGEQQFEEVVNADFVDIGELARKHVERLAHAPHMIEIEFLDEPNRAERFFRMGTDPSGMHNPIAIDLRKGR